MTTSNSSNKNGPSTLADRALKAWHERGMIFIRFASGHEVSFPTKGNPRLESAAEEDVGRIEISPFGLHWPTLDEDLSFKGILEGVAVNGDRAVHVRQQTLGPRSQSKVLRGSVETRVDGHRPAGSSLGLETADITGALSAPVLIQKNPCPMSGGRWVFGI